MKQNNSVDKLINKISDTPICRVSGCYKINIDVNRTTFSGLLCPTHRREWLAKINTTEVRNSESHINVQRFINFADKVDDD